MYIHVISVWSLWNISLRVYAYHKISSMDLFPSEGKHISMFNMIIHWCGSIRVDTKSLKKPCHLLSPDLLFGSILCRKFQSFLWNELSLYITMKVLLTQCSFTYLYQDFLFIITHYFYIRLISTTFKDSIWKGSKIMSYYFCYKF